MLPIILLVVRLEHELSNAGLGGRAGWGLLCSANRAMFRNALSLCCIGRQVGSAGLLLPIRAAISAVVRVRTVRAKPIIASWLHARAPLVQIRTFGAVIF